MDSEDKGKSKRPSWTSATAPRQGGAPGRVRKSTLFRTNMELLAASKNISPLELCLGMLGDETLPLSLRKNAADTAIQYVHKSMPRAIEHSGELKLHQTFAQAVLRDGQDDTNKDAPA